MMILVALVAVELAVTLSFSAVCAFVSGFLSTPGQSHRQNPGQACHRCGAAMETGPDQDGAAKGRQQ
jgi:hypothetical protein